MPAYSSRPSHATDAFPSPDNANCTAPAGHRRSRGARRRPVERRLERLDSVRFGYWLKGEAPAKWITDGQTWLERKAILDANK